VCGAFDAAFAELLWPLVLIALHVEMIAKSLHTMQDVQSEKSPLHYAIEKRDEGLVRLLLELARTPAAVAASKASSGSRCASLESAMLNAQTGYGNAALHLAVSVRYMSKADKQRLVQLLLSRGADASAKNSEGQLPRDMTNDQEVVPEFEDF